MFLSAGKPLDIILSPEEIIRFLGKVEVVDVPGTKVHGCWRWLAGKQKGEEYGKIALRRKTYIAHRVSFQVFVGPLLEAETVDHICRNPWCVNPQHLQAMTHSENVTKGNEDRVQDTVAVGFMGGPIDGEERHFFPAQVPETFEIKTFGQVDTYRYSEDLAEFIYDGYRRTKKRRRT